MSKDYLEALERIKNKFIDFFHEDNIDVECIEDALLELKKIEESNPSKALECLEILYYNLKSHMSKENPMFDLEYDTIKQALIKAQELEKENDELENKCLDLLGDNIRLESILKIIFEKNVDIWLLKSCLTVELYNFSITKIDNCNVFNLTKEEFDLLKKRYAERG